MANILTLSFFSEPLSPLCTSLSEMPEWGRKFAITACKPVVSGKSLKFRWEFTYLFWAPWWAARYAYRS